MYVKHICILGFSFTCVYLLYRAGNFSEFTKHLEGLASIYQLNADKYVIINADWMFVNVYKQNSLFLLREKERLLI